MRFLRPLAAALGLGSTLVTYNAAAQVGMVLGEPQWSGRPASSQELTEINRQDCLADDAQIKFGVDLTGADSSHLLEVWSGAGCNVKTNRDQNNSCIEVFEEQATPGDVTVSVRDILQKAQTDAAGIGTGSEETCNQGGSSAATERTLYFMVLNPSALDTPLAFKEWKFYWDLIAPAAPTGVSAGPGEQSLIVEFTAPEDDDLNQYRFYCAADEGACSSTLLVPGMAVPSPLPEGMTECGSTNAQGASDGDAGKLANGQSHAVAMAAEDDLGNLSVLSEVACGTPKDVTGYYEAYSAAGGQAGGGFCSFAPPRRGALPLGIGLLLACGLLRRRR